jgi:hypothetical protein
MSLEHEYQDTSENQTVSRTYPSARVSSNYQ